MSATSKLQWFYRLADTENRPVVDKWGEERTEIWGKKMQITIYRMDKQGLTIWHGELYSISYDKL